MRRRGVLGWGCECVCVFVCVLCGLCVCEQSMCVWAVYVRGLGVGCVCGGYEENIHIVREAAFPRRCVKNN